MKKKTIFVLIVTILAIAFFVMIFKSQVGEWKNGLASPLTSTDSNLIKSQVKPAPTPIPTPSAPKTFKFDRSSDLKSELGKVNPEILDSDFE